MTIRNWDEHNLLLFKDPRLGVVSLIYGSLANNFAIQSERRYERSQRH